MGFISNQWLNRGLGLRNRSYTPVPVAIAADVSTDTWSRRNQVTVEVRARRSNSEYQTLHLNSIEAEVVAYNLIDACSDEGRERIAMRLLRLLPDGLLLKVLAKDLKARVKAADS